MKFPLNTLLINNSLHNYKNKLIISKVFGRRYYSSLDSRFISPTPFIILNNLNKDNIKDYRELLLNNKAGIYSFFNTMNGNQYIGSAKNLYLRLNEHVNNRKSNAALQAAFDKYGLDMFNFYVYQTFTYISKNISNQGLTDLETSYIAKFDFKTLYNFKAIGTSSLGYKHIEEAILKMVKRFENKENHPMYGKNHTKETLTLISKPGDLNPMFGKKHSQAALALMSEKRNKYPLGVGIYDLNDNLLFKFRNNVELAKHLNISKVTVGKYLNNNLVYNKIYIFKPIQD
jgi:group I intron endonuclease